MAELNVNNVVAYLRDPVNRRGARTMVELYLGIFTQASDAEVLTTLRDALSLLLEEIQ